MKELVHDKHGGFCAAKTWFSIASAIILIKFAVAGVSFNAISFGAFDAAGASMLLSAFGAVYYGRSRTKAEKAYDQTL